MLTRERIRELIDEHGLTDRADEIMADAKPCIRLKLRTVENENDIPIGASKMGGSPDVPTNFEFPIWNETPLDFIAQFRLSHVKSLDREDLLPPKGMVYIFFDIAAYAKLYYGQKLSDIGPYKVFYLDDENTPLVRMPDPANKPYHYVACSIEFEPQLSPPIEHHIFTTDERNELASVKEERWKFREMHWKAGEDFGQPFHQLLGNENDIQGAYSMMREASSAWSVGEAKDWILLLQVDSDGSSLFQWGDAGMIYFCISKNDLLTRNFDRVWVYFTEM